MCKSSQLACSQMLWSAESAGCTFDTWEWCECLNLVTSCCLDVPSNVGGPHGKAGLIKVYCDKMPKLAETTLCLGIWITPFLSSPVYPKPIKKGTGSTADSGTRVTAPPALGRALCCNPVPEAKFLLIWTMYFHCGSGVNLAAESHPLPPSFPGCKIFWSWSFSMP